MPDKDAIRAELEVTRTAYHELLHSLSNDDWPRRSGNPEMTVKELMWHVAWATSWMASSGDAVKSGKSTRIPSFLIEPGRKLAMRWLARSATPARAAQKYDEAYATLLTKLDSVRDDDWSREATRFGEVRSVAWYFSHAREHFEEHARDVRAVLPISGIVVVTAALAPYRVLDLTGEIGQFAGRCFAELGADVIKVEPPDGDPVRRIGPFVHDEPKTDRSLLWFTLNASKRAVTLDIEKPDGQGLLRKLIANADLVIESYAPRYLTSIGLDQESIRREQPKLVWVSVTGYGQDGPYAGYKWSDMIGQALAGLLFLWGEPNKPPSRPRAAQGYYHASMGAALSGMVALYHARRTGRGQYVDVSMQEVLTFVLAGPGGVSGYWSLEGMNITRSGPGINLGHLISRTIYNCKEGYVAVSTMFGPHFPRLLELMKKDNAAGFLAEDPKWLNATRFAPLPTQWRCEQADADAAEDLFSKWLLLYTREEIMEMAGEHGLMIFPVLDVPDNLTNKQLEARKYWKQVRHEEIDTTVTYPGPPVRMTATPWEMKSPAPRLGQHNEEVFTSLGLSSTEIAGLKAEGTV